MVARSPTSSNQRPDTLMQDRPPPTRRKPLATHGRTIHWGQIRTSGAMQGLSVKPPKAEIWRLAGGVAVVPEVDVIIEAGVLDRPVATRRNQMLERYLHLHNHAGSWRFA